MTARNRKAFDDGQVVMAAVKAIMATHSPLQRPLTAKTIIARLPPHLVRDERTIRLHMQRVRETEEIGCQRGNLSAS